MAHALLRQGAEAVVTSLWPVEDAASARFVDHSYDALLGDHGDGSGRSVASAVCHAMRRMRADYAHPWQWAAFQALGGTNRRFGPAE